jgi:hypothetical protein
MKPIMKESLSLRELSVLVEVLEQHANKLRLELELELEQASNYSENSGIQEELAYHIDPLRNKLKIMYEAELKGVTNFPSYEELINQIE